MKTTFSKLALIIAATSVSLTAFASDSQYVPGLEGIKGSVLPPPGVYYRGYLSQYSADKNEALPDGSEVTATALVNRVAWVTPQKILGGDLILDSILPLVNIDLNIGDEIVDERTALGDFYASGLLAWHGDRWDTVAGAGWYFSGTGDFDDARAASPGKSYDSLSFTLGGNVKLNKAADIDLSILGTYEIPKEDGLDEELMLEWGLSKNYGALDVGVVGYNTFETGAGDEKRNAVGLSMAYFSEPLLLGGDVAVYKEYDNKNTFEGNLVRASLTKAF